MRFRCLPFHVFSKHRLLENTRNFVLILRVTKSPNSCRSFGEWKSLLDGATRGAAGGGAGGQSGRLSASVAERWARGCSGSWPARTAPQFARASPRGRGFALKVTRVTSPPMFTALGSRPCFPEASTESPCPSGAGGMCSRTVLRPGCRAAGTREPLQMFP